MLTRSAEVVKGHLDSAADTAARAFKSRTPALPYVAKSLGSILTHTPDFIHETKKGKRLSPVDTLIRAPYHYAVDFLNVPIILYKGAVHAATGKPSRH